MTKTKDLPTIRTSQADWLAALAKAYSEKNEVILVDDAEMGLNPNSESLIAMGKKAGLTKNEWVAAGVAVGIAGLGGFLLIMAILDPEPFSKLGFTIGSGAFLTLGGGFSAIRVLTNQHPPTITISPSGGFILSWK